MRTLLLCAVLLCCPGCCRAGGGSARAVIEDFYKAYLSRPAGPAKPMDLPFSRSFLELKKNNSAACAAYAGTDICGWGADGDIYLDTQEYDPGLNYKNSGFKAVEAKPGVIDVAFNVYPGEKKQPAYYDKKLRYLLVKEGGAWVVDDLLAAGRSARAAMLDEIAFYTKQGGAEGEKKMENTVYGFTVKTALGEAYALAALRGRVTLVVNVASKCGFTPQYAGLEALYKKYKEKGFTVLGFPCNQFGGQEPGSNEEIQSFCRLNYGVSFPVMGKIEVNGDGADPLYVHLKAKAPGVLGSEAIKWNFTKFLVGKDGQVLNRYAPQTRPEDLDADIAQALGLK